VLEYEGTKLSPIFSAVGQTIWIFPETLTAVHSHVLESIMATFVVEENFARAGLPVISHPVSKIHTPQNHTNICIRHGITILFVVHVAYATGHRFSSVKSIISDLKKAASSVRR
jgi:hypothetical protein